MSALRCLGAACGLLLLSCGGGGGAAPAPPSTQTPAPAPAAPTELKAVYDAASAQVTLTWTPPKGSFDGYNLFIALHGGAYTRVNQGLIPGSAREILLSFTSTPPELTALDFRLGAVSGSQAGPYSDVAEVTIPLTAPAGINAFYSAAEGGVQLFWWTQSQATERYVLERAPCDAGGNPSAPWSAVPLASPGSTSCLDQTGAESMAYRYRVTAWSGTASSAASAPSQPVAIPVQAPASLATQSLPSAVRLSWVNRSQTATQIQITRVPSGLLGTSVIATLPASATTYLDENLPLANYTYGVSATDGALASTEPTIVGAPANPPGSPVLAATPLPAVVTLDTAALSPDGNWAYGNSSPWAILPAPWATWPTWAPGTVHGPRPGFLAFDAQSAPHAVYLTDAPTTTTVVHAWFGAGAWNMEEVQQLPLSQQFLPSAFGLSRGGDLHLLQDTGNGQSLQGLTYFHRVDGAWAPEPIEASPAGPSYYGTPRLFLDAADTPHVLVPTWQDAREYSRQADGTWSSQVLPSPVPGGGTSFFLDGVWLDDRTAWVFYLPFDPVHPENDGFQVLRKVAGVWQPPTTLLALQGSLRPSASIALSPDGTRVAAVCDAGSELRLYTWTAQGWIESLLPVTGLTYPYFKIGFDRANRLHVLVKASAYAPDVVEFRE